VTPDVIYSSLLSFGVHNYLV